uniref:Uncharacterized protein n=1 Tax=Glyptapanteles flavicoxis TaxID=463051 RepID=B7S8C3_9HYME|nr:hypothetical protein GFP_L3_0090 [Glyptapanteles flavicoxis]
MSPTRQRSSFWSSRSRSFGLGQILILSYLLYPIFGRNINITEGDTLTRSFFSLLLKKCASISLENGQTNLEVLARRLILPLVILEKMHHQCGYILLRAWETYPMYFIKILVHNDFFEHYSKLNRIHKAVIMVGSVSFTILLPLHLGMSR